MATAREVLQKARKLIERRENWCQGTGAKTASGLSVHELSPGAVQFCMVGALHRALEGADDALLRGRCRELLHTAIPGPLTLFNDYQPHQAVLNAFDAAIAAAE